MNFEYINITYIMDYFLKYGKCVQYYTLYKKRCKNKEFMQFYKRYTVNGYLYVYTLDGVFHHDTKPAITEYIENNIITNESYFVNGRRENLKGPAVIYYDNDGNLIQSSYYLDDVLKNSINHRVHIY